jgi:hypothetical protein
MTEDDEFSKLMIKRQWLVKKPESVIQENLILPKYIFIRQLQSTYSD